jgi:coenzyme F420-0:L-glutamate ligase/coenzyme F420-1:gamma-L-glutamate ligase
MNQREFRVIPIKSRLVVGRFDLGPTIIQNIKSQGQSLTNGDILVVSSKYAAMAEGRYVELDRVEPSPESLRLASKYKLDPSLAELVLQESESILGGIPGFLLTVSKGILAPNGGIDRSNVPKGYAILYPKNPELTALKIRSYLRRANDQVRAKPLTRLGVILSDSRVTPTRLGTIGIAIASAGFRPVVDFRGKKDLFGNELKVTLKAVADQLSSCAQLVMGEAKEATPIVIIRGYRANFNSSMKSKTSISYKKCLYIQGLKNAP